MISFIFTVIDHGRLYLDFKTNFRGQTNCFWYNVLTINFSFLFLSWFFFFTNIHDSQESSERGRLSLNSSLYIPCASQKLIPQQVNYCREVTAAHSFAHTQLWTSSHTNFLHFYNNSRWYSSFNNFYLINRYFNR